MPDHSFENGYVPIPLALIVCDYVYRDTATGKHAILGTFSGLMGKQYPLTVNTLAAYVAFTESQGNLTVTIKLVDANESREPLFATDFHVTSVDPRQVHELAINIEALQIPQPDEYRIQLIINQEVLLERKFLAMMVKQDLSQEGESHHE